MFNNNSKDKVSADLKDVRNEIGQGTTITGNIETYGNIHVEGEIHGDLTTKLKAVFAPKSQITGNIVAKEAQISGKVQGTIRISDTLTLKPTAVVDGDIYTNKLIVETGASFNGNCHMGEQKEEIILGASKDKAKLNGRKEAVGATA